MIMPDDIDPKASAVSDAFPSAAANDAGPGAPGDAPEAAAFQPDPLEALEAEKADLKDKLLRTLAANPGRVYSRQALLEALWGGAEYRDPRTIDVHVRHLREKIEPDPSEPHYLFTVRGVGYRFREVT